MKLGVMVSLPLGGKSTYCEFIKKNDYVIVCPDKIRVDMFGIDYVQNGKDEGTVWWNVKNTIKTLLLDNKDVMLDACNITRRGRKDFRKIAEKYGAEFEIHWMKTSLKECLSRQKNANRNQPVVLPEVIRSMYERFQEPTDVEGTIISVPLTFEKNSRIFCSCEEEFLEDHLGYCTHCGRKVGLF